jgi:hypothetical protein
MPKVIDTPEEMEAHKAHVIDPQPETCDLCWMEVPFSERKMMEIEKALQEMGGGLRKDK